MAGLCRSGTVGQDGGPMGNDTMKCLAPLLAEPFLGPASTKAPASPGHLHGGGARMTDTTRPLHGP